jgi:hypothetical protein
MSDWWTTAAPWKRLLLAAVFLVVSIAMLWDLVTNPHHALHHGLLRWRVAELLSPLFLLFFLWQTIRALLDLIRGFAPPRRV